MEGENRNGWDFQGKGNWTLASPYILQCEACFPLETQPAVPVGNICWRMERIGMSVCVCVCFFIVSTCVQVTIFVLVNCT